MTDFPFNYDPGRLGNSANADYDRTRVRLLIGDTSTARLFNLSDSEVEYFVGAESSINMAASKAARALAAKYATVPTSKKVGDLALVRAEYDRLTALAGELLVDATAAAVPIVGGVSIADKQARENDGDRTSPAFRRGANDYPGTSQPGGSAASETTADQGWD